jgi:DnaJ-class molecular chaperone
MDKVLKAVSRLTGQPITPGLGIATVPCDACRGTGRRSTPNPHTAGRIPCRRCDGVGTAPRTPTDPTKVSP